MGAFLLENAAVSSTGTVSQAYIAGTGRITKSFLYYIFKSQTMFLKLGSANQGDTK